MAACSAAMNNRNTYIGVRFLLGAARPPVSSLRASWGCTDTDRVACPLQRPHGALVLVPQASLSRAASPAAGTSCPYSSRRSRYPTLLCAPTLLCCHPAACPPAGCLHKHSRVPLTAACARRAAGLCVRVRLLQHCTEQRAPPLMPFSCIAACRHHAVCHCTVLLIVYIRQI